MSQGRFSPPLAPEDDWFDEPVWFDEPDVPLSPGSEEPHERRTGHSESARSSQPPRGRRDWRILGAAVIGALALLIGGVLTARAFTGSDNAVETTESTTSTTTTLTTTTDTTTASTTSDTTTTTSPEATSLRPGDESAEVRQLQTDLVSLGYSTGGVDGKYGPATEQAVRDFQTSSGLVVDGVAGPATLAALAQALGA